MGTHPIFESDFDCLTEMDFNLNDFGQPGPNPTPSYSEPIHQNPHMIRQSVPSFSSPKIANQNQVMQPTYQSEDSQSQPEQSSQDSLDNSHMSDPGLTNRKRKRPSIDQSEHQMAVSVNGEKNGQPSFKRLDFSQEI